MTPADPDSTPALERPQRTRPGIGFLAQGAEVTRLLRQPGGFEGVGATGAGLDVHDQSVAKCAATNQSGPSTGTPLRLPRPLAIRQ